MLSKLPASSSVVYLDVGTPYQLTEPVWVQLTIFRQKLSGIRYLGYAFFANSLISKSNILMPTLCRRRLSLSRISRGGLFLTPDQATASHIIICRSGAQSTSTNRRDHMLCTCKLWTPLAQCLKRPRAFSILARHSFNSHLTPPPSSTYFDTTNNTIAFNTKVQHRSRGSPLSSSSSTWRGQRRRPSKTVQKVLSSTNTPSDLNIGGTFRM